MQAFYRWQGEDLLLYCQLQPKASNDAFAGLIDGHPLQRLKIRISAPPIDGRANEQLQHFLAQQFGVARSLVVIEQGDSSRLKTVRIRAPSMLPAGLGIEP